MELLELPPVEVLHSHFIDGGHVLLRKDGKPAGTKGGPYCRVRVPWQGVRAQYYAHRILWKMRHGDEPERIDHRDGNRRNNADDNLRVATRSDNAANQGDQRPASGHKNVYQAASGNYFAMIRKDGTLHRTSTTTLANAILDSEALRLEHFGEFARAG